MPTWCVHWFYSNFSLTLSFGLLELVIDACLLHTGIDEILAQFDATKRSSLQEWIHDENKGKSTKHLTRSVYDDNPKTKDYRFWANEQEYAATVSYSMQMCLFTIDFNWFLALAIHWLSILRDVPNMQQLQQLTSTDNYCSTGQHWLSETLLNACSWYLW